MIWTISKLLVVIVFLNIKLTYACNGYHLKLNHIKDCNSQNVVKVMKGYDVILDKDCFLSIKGCLDFTKRITVAKANYTVNKPPLPPIEGDVDMCELGTSSSMPIITQSINALGFPTKCPVEKQKICGSPDKKIDLSAYKNQLGMGAGTTQVKLYVNHEPGITCTQISMTLSKANRG